MNALALSLLQAALMLLSSAQTGTLQQKQQAITFATQALATVQESGSVAPVQPVLEIQQPQAPVVTASIPSAVVTAPVLPTIQPVNDPAIVANCRAQHDNYESQMKVLIANPYGFGNVIDAGKSQQVANLRRLELSGDLYCDSIVPRWDSE